MVKALLQRPGSFGPQGGMLEIRISRSAEERDQQANQQPNANKRRAAALAGSRFEQSATPLITRAAFSRNETVHCPYKLP
jgi:hypothetical protein